MDLIETNSDHWGVLFSPVNEKLVLKVLKPVCQGANCRNNVGKGALT